MLCLYFPYLGRPTFSLDQTLLEHVNLNCFLNVMKIIVSLSLHLDQLRMPVTPATALLFDLQYVMLQWPVLASRLPPPTPSGSKICAANPGAPLIAECGYICIVDFITQCAFACQSSNLIDQLITKPLYLLIFIA